MTNIIKEIADKIDGNEYRNEITPEVLNLLKENGLIAVFGASDDLCEFRGAYYDELDAWGGATLLWNEDGFINDSEEDENGFVKQFSKDNRFYIDLTWCADESKCWGFETNIPGAEKFQIMEDGAVYGEGLIIPFQTLLSITPELIK